MSKQYQSAHSMTKTVENGEIAYDFNDRAAYIANALEESGQKNVHKTHDGHLKGISFDLAKELEAIVNNVADLKTGDKHTACVDLTIGEYVQERYGIPTNELGHMDNFLRLIGVNKRTTTLGQLAGKSNIKFTTIPELNKSYEWLIGETITEAIRGGMIQRGLFRRLVASMETAAFDSIVVPVIKNANGFYQELREGETIQVGAIEFDEIKMETKDVGTAFRLTDRVVRNVTLNLLQTYLASANGQNLDIQLTNEAVERLINGNQPGFQDAAPIIGVQAPGAFDYDEDWLELVIGMAQLGYFPDLVLGVRAMIKEAMALPEFKGFDGNTVKADTELGVPYPADYRFEPTGAMPAKAPGGGQLLFVDPRYAMRHYTTKPLTIESDRLIRNLTEEFVVSMTSVFVKEQADAAMILDSSVNIATNPFPTEYDMELYERNAGGFKRGI